MNNWLRTKFDAPHPSIWMFISLLKEAFLERDSQRRQQGAGQVVAHRNSDSQTKNDELERVRLSFEERHISVLEFLRSTSNIIGINGIADSSNGPIGFLYNGESAEVLTSA